MEINVLIDEDVRECPPAEWLQNLVEQVLIAQGISLELEVGLVITGQERVQELNRTYRHKDEPTDVLAFTMSNTGEESDSNSFIMPPDEVLHLGEVIISCPQAMVQADEQGHSLEREMAVLIIHGMLHLLGYDHEEPEMERRMMEREAEILSYIEAEIALNGRRK